MKDYIFRQKIFAIALDTSFYDHEKAMEYYKNQLERLSGFYSRNREFYNYFTSTATKLDDQFFVRRNSQDFVNPDIDYCFSTGYNQQVARILAYDSLKEYLKSKIASNRQHTDKTTSKLTWTASKTDLVELIYALQAQNCISCGSSRINEIVDLFTTTFHIDLKDYYRTYIEIRMRKTSRSKFLDMLKKKPYTTHGRV